MKLFCNTLKTLTLWFSRFSMAVVFIAILNVSSVEAKSLKNGEEFKANDGSVIRVISSDEVEIEIKVGILLGKYTIDGERVRVVTSRLGTGVVNYYKITPDGLSEEKEGRIFYSKAGLAGLAALEEKRKRAEEEERKAVLAAVARRFKDNENGTVTDNDTKLMWQQGENGSKHKDYFNAGYTWAEAISYCKGLPLAGYNDWRLPDVAELKSILNTGKNPAINKTYFPNIHNDTHKNNNYWSSTSLPDNDRFAWYVNFDTGYVDSGGGKDYFQRIRCVRSSTNNTVSSAGTGTGTSGKTSGTQQTDAAKELSRFIDSPPVSEEEEKRLMREEAARAARLNSSPDLMRLRQSRRDALKRNDYQGIIDPSLQILQIDPADYESLDYLANLYTAVNEPDKALVYAAECLKRVVRPRTFALITQAYLMKKDKKNTLLWLEKTLQSKYPHHPAEADLNQAFPKDQSEISSIFNKYR